MAGSPTGEVADKSPPFPPSALPFLTAMSFGRTGLKALHLARDPEARVQQIIPLLDENPVYKQFLLKLPILQERIKTWLQEEDKNPRAEDIALERTIGLLGKHSIRNVLLSIRLLRLQNGGLPKKKADRFSLDPLNILKMGLSIEDFCMEKTWAGGFDAFVAGAHYDWLSGLLTGRKGPREAGLVLESAWKEGLDKGKIAYQLASQLKNFKYQSMSLPAGILAPIGKVMMVFNFPSETGAASWSGFALEAEKKKERKQPFLLYAENARFGMSHRIWTGIVVDTMDYFKAIEPALVAYAFPWDLAEVDPELFRLALLLFVADRMQSGGPLKASHKKALSILKIPESILPALLKKARPEKE